MNRLRWRLSEDPPEIGGGREPDPAEAATEEFLDRVDPDRQTLADELAEEAAANPEADPLRRVEERGGYSLGTGPEANPGRMLRHVGRAE